MLIPAHTFTFVGCLALQRGRECVCVCVCVWWWALNRTKSSWLKKKRLKMHSRVVCYVTLVCFSDIRPVCDRKICGEFPAAPCTLIGPNDIIRWIHFQLRSDRPWSTQGASACWHPWSTDNKRLPEQSTLGRCDYIVLFSTRCYSFSTSEVREAVLQLFRH